MEEVRFPTSRERKDKLTVGVAAGIDGAACLISQSIAIRACRCARVCAKHSREQQENSPKSESHCASCVLERFVAEI